MYSVYVRKEGGDGDILFIIGGFLLRRVFFVYYESIKREGCVGRNNSEPSSGSSGHAGGTSPGQTRKKPKDLSALAAPHSVSHAIC